MYSKIISHFDLSLNKKDEWQPIKCYTHEDSTKSAAIHLEFRKYNCFVCGKKHLDLVHQELFGEKYEHTEEENETIENTDFNFLAEFYPEYFKPKAIRHQVQELSQFLLEKNLDWSTIEYWKGEYVSNENDSEVLYGYLKFPLEGGGYTARKILPMPDDKRPRFKNSKNDKHLLGNFREHDTIILVEGLTDFLTLWQMGYTNVCTSLGSKLSDQQAYLLRNKIVFIIFDRDYAGYIGAQKATESLKKYGCTVVNIELPDNKQTKNDLNDMYVKDESVLRSFLKVALTRHSTYDNTYLERMIRDTKITKLWPTGIPTLDKKFRGGFGVGVYAFAGEEKIGKSLTVTTMIHSFINAGARVLLASYELPKLQYWCRIASKFTNEGWADLEIQPSLISDRVWLEHLYKISSSLKIEVGLTMDEISAARDSFDIIIIDYIQRMPPPIHGMDERSATLQNNRALSDLMANHNKTIVMISSMPRSSYGKSNATMYKNTGDIEYTVQGGILMQKEDTNTISYLIRQNTRGESGAKIFAEVDWQHQTITERESYL